MNRRAILLAFLLIGMGFSLIACKPFFVSVEMETAETSALYPETQTSFYVELIRNNDDLWLIEGFFTGGIEKRRKL